MKKFISYIFILFTTNLFSQEKLPENLLTYYKNASKARFCFYQKKYDSCNYYYQKAFAVENTKKLYQDEFCLSMSYAHTKNYDSSFKFLISSISKSPSLFFYHDQIQMDRDSFSIKEPILKYVEFNKKYNNDLYSLYLVKKDMYKHQNLFNSIRDSNWYFYINDMVYSTTNNKCAVIERNKNVIDSSLENRINYEKKLVDFIIRNDCIISVNNYGNETFFMCVLHLSQENLKKVFPIIRKEAYQANISPYVFGAYIERLIKNDNWNATCSGFRIMYPHECMVEDYPQIIENRNLIGLNNYLTEDDYSLNTFSKIYRNREIQPWINLLNE